MTSGAESMFRSRQCFSQCAVSLMVMMFIFAGGVTSVMAAERQLAHMVYFKLKDDSEASRARMVEACKKYLSKHEGTVYFSAGVVAKEFDREVNDRDFDIALNLVFASKAAHDQYQSHPRHLKFIEENRDSWAKVRVFDSYVETSDE
jgi:hypothetical protein